MGPRAVFEAADHLFEESFPVGAEGEAVHDDLQAVRGGIVPGVIFRKSVEPLGLLGYDV